MSFEENISAFMDFALSPDEEADFLHILSISPEKREVFHSYMGVRAAVLMDMKSTTVPTNLDVAVLAPFTAPVAATALYSSSTRWTLKHALVASVVAMVIFGTGFVTSDLFHSKISVLNGTANPGHSVPRNELKATHPSTQILPQITGNSAQRSSPEIRTILRDRLVYVVDTLYKAPSIVRVFDTVASFIRDTVYLAKREQPVKTVRTISEVHLPGGLLPAAESFLRKIDIEIQREHLTTNPYIDLSNLGVKRTQQNMAMLSSYAFDSHHAAGIIVGQKAFAMEYYKIEKDSIYLYQQQPLLTYGGAFYRFSLPITSGIVPHALLQIGGSDVGPVFGLRLGIKVTPIPHFSLIAAANESLLAYRYKEKMFASNSLGFLYGINIQF